MSEYQIVLDYLLQNNLIESEEYADGFISVMSENWIDSILNEELSYITERRRFKAVRDEATGKLSKVKQEKVPLWVKSNLHSRLGSDVTGKSTLKKTKEGKWVKFNPYEDNPDYRKSDRIINPRAIAGRIKQGMSTTPPEKRVDHGPNTGELSKSRSRLYGRHPQGGRSEGEGEIGSSRGVRKQKGAKGRSSTPVSRFLAHKEYEKGLKKQWQNATNRFSREDAESSLRVSRSKNPLNVARRRAEQRRQSKG